MLIVFLAFLLISNIDSDKPEGSFYDDEYILEYSDNEVVPEGIYVGSNYIGGMTKAGARDVLSGIYKTPVNVQVVVNWGSNSAKTSLSNLGVITNVDKTIDRCISIGKNGGLIQRYKTEQDLNACGFHAEIDQTVDKDKTAKFLKENLGDKYNEPSRDASIELDAQGSPYISDGTSGRELNVSMTISYIQEGFLDLNGGDTISVDAIISDTSPKVTADMLKNCTDKLGSSTTVYLKTDYKTDRACNVELAASRVGGTLVKPGEKISVSSLMGSRTEENGYKMGTQYVNGVLEDSIGGGVCQVATTLYQSLLYAEIKVNTRYNHSLTVGYSEPSLDAAISEGVQDLEFTNNLENNIYLYSFTDGKNITFIIFGKEYRDANRKVEYLSIVDERITTEPKYVDDPDLYEGEYKADGDNHDYVKSHMDKVVYVDGEEVSRETIHNDVYQASQQIIYRGTKKKTETTTDTGNTTGNTTTTTAAVAQ